MNLDSKKRAAGRQGHITEADRRFLLDSQKRLIKTLRRLASGRTGRMLDDKFEDFDLPLVAKRRRQPSSPSGVVLASDTALIKASELDKYKAALAAAREHSQEMRNLDVLMCACSRRIQDTLERTGTVYRGMGIAELEIISERHGIFGFHSRTMYAARGDFVSFSVDAGAALRYARGKAGLGLLIEADVSRVDQSEYTAVDYTARNHVKVAPGGRRIYNPYEMFGGHISGVTMYEAEVHLRVGSKPVIKAVIVPDDRPMRFRRRLEKAVAVLERAQARRITIKYVPDHVISWQIGPKRTRRGRSRS